MKKSTEILAWIGQRIGKPPGWERVVRMFASPAKCHDMGEICVAKEGVVFIAQPAVPLGWHIAFFGTYEPELREIFRAVLPVGGVALDVGANVGWHTLLMAKLVGADGRVLAAEANPSVRKRLAENLGINRFRHVDVIPYAIADTEGTVEFFGPEAGDASSGDGHVVSADMSARSGVIQVETRRIDALDAVAQIQRLDLIKIDVEGYEWPVLLGAEQTIAKFRPHIVFEFNQNYVARGGGTIQSYAEFFQRHRYRLFAIGRNWADAMDQANWRQCADIWAVPLDATASQLIED
jgi:FkbM family methyltransferase